MSAALQPVPRAAATPGRPELAALRLEDFSIRSMTGDPAGPGTEALQRARLEGQAEGAAQARDRQLDDLTEALRQHAAALRAAAADQALHIRETRTEIAVLLRAVAGALLPAGRDARLVEALVQAVDAAGEAAAVRARIHCPAHLHEQLRQACRAAGLAVPALTAAPEVALHLDGGAVRIDLAAMQARILQLINAYATGDP